MDVAIVGGGIAGLALALNLQARKISCRVFEAAAEIKELGVGITLLPHAMREIAALGLQEPVAGAGIENRESAFFNRFGQLIYKEPRGGLAGYPFPEICIHRGRLHALLYQAVRTKLGPENMLTGQRCVGLEQDESGVTLHFRDVHGGAPEPVRADIAIACDGINSAVRAQFYPQEPLAFAGINTWRGVTRHKPILGGRTYIRIGSIRTGKIVIYPIADAADPWGNQLINWTTEVQMDSLAMNDWNKPGQLTDFLPIYETWRFPWLDVADLIEKSDAIFEYPMVDRDPVPRWTFGRVTLAGDAAHPMYQRGSNGAAQALIDARALADCLVREEPFAALAAYEKARLETTANIVQINREQPPDFLNIRVEELTGDRPFDDLDNFITQDELRALSERYKRVAGFGLQDLS